MIDKKTREYIVKLSGLVHDINSEGKHTVFFRYSGHVNELNIKIYLGGWTEENENVKDWSSYFDKEYEVNFEGNCKSIISYMKGLLDG